MNTSKIALNFDPNDPPVLTPVETIVSMFEHTDADGILCIPAWPYDDDAEQGMLYQCRMNWNKADLENVLRQYENCCDTMKKIAEKYEAVLEYVPPGFCVRRYRRELRRSGGARRQRSRGL